MKSVFIKGNQFIKQLGFAWPNTLHFFLNFPFWSPWNHEKIFDFPENTRKPLVFRWWIKRESWKANTAWKMSKYGFFSGPYFPVFRLNTEIYSVNLRIQSKYRKIRTRKKSVFGHFSRSERVKKHLELPELFLETRRK